MLNFEFNAPDTPRRPSASQYAMQWSQGLNSIGDTIESIATRKRQDALQRFLMQQKQEEMGMKRREHAYDYGSPIDPNAMVGTPTGQMAKSSFMPGGQGQVGAGSSLIEQFNQWRAGGMPKDGARAEFMPALGKDERKEFYDIANPKPASIFMSPYQTATIGLKTEEVEMKRREAEAKRREAEAAAQQADKDQAEKARTISQKIDEALELVGPMTAGFGGSIMGKVSGSEAVDLQGVLDTIKANLGFDQLLELKQGSKNGSSGLGALSENEMKLLTSLSQSLDRNQGDKRLEKNLIDLKNKYSGFQNALGFNGNGQNGSAAPSGQPAGKIRVRNKSTGQTGSISEKFFDPNKYERVP